MFKKIEEPKHMTTAPTRAEIDAARAELTAHDTEAHKIALRELADEAESRATWEKAQAEWMAIPDGEKAMLIDSWLGKKGDRPVTITLSRYELAELHKAHFTKWFNINVTHALWQTSKGSIIRGQQNLLARRQYQIREIIGDAAADDAEKEALEAFWKGEKPELRTAWESKVPGAWQAYLDKQCADSLHEGVERRSAAELADDDIPY